MKSSVLDSEAQSMERGYSKEVDSTLRCHKFRISFE
jgi:hypothetical protein